MYFFPLWHLTWLRSSATWHLRLHVWPQPSWVSHRAEQIFLIASEHFRSISCPHAGKANLTFTLHGGHSSQHFARQLCKFALHFFKQSNLHFINSWSITWHRNGQVWPHFSWGSEHFIVQPPFGLLAAMSSAVRTLQRISGCTWHFNSRESPVQFISINDLYIFFQDDDFSRSWFKLPIIKRPTRARESATQTLFALFKNPIVPDLLLRTNDTNTMSFSSPW